MELTIENVSEVIEAEVNPVLALHQGGCEVTSLDVENNTITIKLFGGCSGCPSSQITLYNGIVPILQEHFTDLTVNL